MRSLVQHLRNAAFCFAIAGLPSQGHAQSSQLDTQQQQTASGATVGVARLTALLRHDAYVLLDEKGKVLGERRITGKEPQTISENAVVEALHAARLTDDQANSLWQALADPERIEQATLPIVKALLSASGAPKAREILWNELEQLHERFNKKQLKIKREQSLLGTFERHRDVLLPLVSKFREPEGYGGDLTKLMMSSRVFGDDLQTSLAWVGRNHPAALAQHLERERSRGRPAKWEATASDHLVEWKNDVVSRLASGGFSTLVELDAAGKTFVAVFNHLYFSDEKRRRMLDGMGASDVFNAVAGGEQELYRMGTSAYRNFQHPLIMKGIREAGSFEAFLQRATPSRFASQDGVLGRRAMVFLRIVSSFGLLGDVLETVRDRDALLATIIASLGDPSYFEHNSSVVLDVLTARWESQETETFKRHLREALYARYNAEDQLALKNVYGSMLSVYQTITGDRKDASIDRAYVVDDSFLRVPFEKLFSGSQDHRFHHRIFMRLNDDRDAAMTYDAFKKLMAAQGASLQSEQSFEVYSLTRDDKTIELYLNKPTPRGVSQGLKDISEALAGNRIDTIIGRGHSEIVPILKSTARDVLGAQLARPAAVFVGSCGSDASVRELIDTFGYSTYLTTRSTGRKLINDAVTLAYIDALLALNPGEKLHMRDMLEIATQKFMKPTGDVALRSDASFYRVNAITVLASRLIEAHVRPRIDKRMSTIGDIGVERQAPVVPR